MALILGRRIGQSVVMDGRFLMTLDGVNTRKQSVMVELIDYADPDSPDASVLEITKGEHILVEGAMKISPRIDSGSVVSFAFDDQNEDKIHVLRSELMTDRQWGMLTGED